MKVSRAWLNRLVDIKDIETEALADLLTNAGHEVEGVETLVKGTNLVIGEVLSCEPHPDSDHLNLTTVNVGTEVLPIVCGAPNVATGQKVIVAKVGAELEGLTIKEATIRGHESKGMICSLKELSLSEDYMSEEDMVGIKVLPSDAPVGENPVEYLGLDDEILDIKQTPNRSDFLSMRAVAIEVAGLTKRALKEVPTLEYEINELPEEFKVDSKTEKCPRFWAKVVGHVEIGESPVWIKQALRGAGMHPINNIVDISNLVMLETGQPNHFYDYRFFKQPEITVVDDYEGTQEALDGNEYKLEKGDIVITSANEAIGIGGIKGLGNSMIQPDTSSIVVEIASFDLVQIRNTSRRLGLSTDASVRYTKEMDPLAPEKALERIIYYLSEYAGAKDFQETVKVDRVEAYKPHTLSVSLNEVNDLLGTHITLEEVVDVFERLALKPEVEGERVTCHIPSYRRDLWIKEDLIEEVIRVVGYDVVESTDPILELTGQPVYTNEQLVVRTLENKLVDMGLHEIMTYTLVGKDKIKTDNPIEILSPLSENRRYVRDYLTPSVLETLKYNIDRKNNDTLYFEMSKVYEQDKSALHLAIVGSGESHKNSWLKTNVKYDFYYIKGLVVELLRSLGVTDKRLQFKENKESEYLHPYQSAKVLFDNKEVGALGVIHPALGIKSGILAEINLNPIVEAKKAKTKFSAIAKYPSVSRDISFVLPENVTYEAVVKTIKKAGKSTLRSVNIFDVFEKDGQKSVALSLLFEDATKTLSEEDINTLMNDILYKLEQDYTITLKK